MLKAFSAFSSVFVSPLFPEKGGEARLSIAFSEPPDLAILRADSDGGNAVDVPMSESGRLNGAFLYSASVRVPSSGPFRYYFAFIHKGRSWYFSKRGLSRPVPCQKDRFMLIPSLKAPSWVASSTCYQIFPDRFAKGDPSVGARNGEYGFDGGVVTVHPFTDRPEPYEKARCLDFYNGDLKGIEDRICYLEDLGVDTLYLNPINEARTVHRYDAVDFFHVDRRLGGDDAFISLSRKLHGRGMRIIVDISINHTGIDCPWLGKALSGKEPERSFYVFEDGKPRYWQGVRTLCQLDYRSSALRSLIYRDPDSVLQRFVRPPFFQDGWRLDVATEVGRSGSSHLGYPACRHRRYILGKALLYLVKGQGAPVKTDFCHPASRKHRQNLLERLMLYYSTNHFPLPPIYIVSTLSSRHNPHMHLRHHVYNVMEHMPLLHYSPARKATAIASTRISDIMCTTSWNTCLCCTTLQPERLQPPLQSYHIP